MRPSGIDRSRRRWLALLASATLASRTRRAVAAGVPIWSGQRVPASMPLQQIRSGEGGTLLAVGGNGELWSYTAALAARKVADGIDPASPVAAGYGRIAARSGDGALFIEADGLHPSFAAGGLAVAAGLLNLPFAVIGIVPDQRRFRVVRFEPTQDRWSISGRSDEAVMPDARPVLATLDEPSSANHPGELVVLAGPDEARYQHGVLGDRIEATRMLYLDRHSLRTVRELTLPAPFVFEDIAPRAVATKDGSGLLTVRSGGTGSRLVLVTADRADAKRLRIAALGDPMSGAHRWLAPTTDGRRLMAVHTPHIGGVLHEYRLAGEQLSATAIADDVANHRIGTRELDLAVWRGTMLIVPSQDRRRLRVFDGAKGWQEQASIPLPSPVVMTTGLADPSRSDAPFAALLEDGTAHRFERH